MQNNMKRQLSDRQFKSAFANPEKSNILINLIHDFLDLEIEEVEYLYPEELHKVQLYKSQVRVLAKLKDGSEVHVMVEMRRDNDFVRRSLRGITEELLSEALRARSDQPFYVIEIDYFKIFDDDSYLRYLVYTEQDQKEPKYLEKSSTEDNIFMKAAVLQVI
ncbi:PD-(D/E)XK nuclease family transposase [Xylocopilactobacillus apicola]|uniref:Transposase n=1 Tax=Xylocopilactobacillus apicola TaxID=2932184 RepID=A0AAU9CXS4_9LACO|nr:PD-(D/E)XK nuclease family transposase [Xylocopilactobacillus apicola]BDR58807.1 hypothetical protein XA3_12480 [Xylocopilactobacillus apicola]